MTSSNGNIFCVTDHLCREFTGHRWIPHTKASDAELWCFFFICAWINGWVNNHEAGGLRRHRAHYDITATEPSLNVVNTATPIPRFRYIPISHDNLYYRILNQFPDSTHPVNVSWYTGIGPVSAKCCLHPNDCGPVLTCLDRIRALKDHPTTWSLMDE